MQGGSKSETTHEAGMTTEIEKLKAALPEMVSDLRDIMINDALRMYEETGITLDEVSSTASIIFTPPDGKSLRVSLTISAEADYDEGQTKQSKSRKRSGTA